MEKYNSVDEVCERNNYYSSQVCNDAKASFLAEQPLKDVPEDTAQCTVFYFANKYVNRKIEAARARPNTADRQLVPPRNKHSATE